MGKGNRNKNRRRRKACSGSASNSAFSASQSGDSVSSQKNATITKYAVGERFPGPVPSQESVVMEMWGQSLNVLIQFPGLSRGELAAFKQGFKRYTYLETGTNVPIANWIFEFPSPHNPIDCNFDARLVNRETITNYLNPADGELANVVYFFLLDGPILRAQKMVGIHTDAVRLFHETIRKQLKSSYNPTDFTLSLSNLHSRYSTWDLARLGQSFKMHGE